MKAAFFTSPLLVLLAGLPLSAGNVSITLEGGEVGREAGLVTFPAGSDLKGTSLLRLPTGQTLPLQIDGDGKAAFIAPALAAGEKFKATAHSVPAAPAAVVVATQAPGVLRFQHLQQPFFTYQMEASAVPAGTSEDFRHGAYLHPIYSPSGKLVTADYPSDHPHQRGVFMAWTKTEFEGRHPDFWNMGKGKDGKLTGEVRFGTLEQSWSGEVHGGFTSKHRWLDHSSGTEKEVLNESWSVTAYAVEIGKVPTHIIDLVSTQTCAGNEPLKLPKYHYGGLGVRGSAHWDPVDKVTMLTSTGADRIRGDASKAQWVWLGGDVEGAPTGTAVLMHPDNFRYPQPLRLNPKNPQLCIAPSVEGDWAIEPGKPLVLRYRLVIRDGKPDAALLDRMLRDYATPPKILVDTF